ncbi:MAG TPA: glutamine ABC transporter ATP-binding protein [Clostridiales bacterium UBA8960]|jgi:polar amino acid transport system ATP-binding protein|nr:glutamine ABC transporter ATP-binding protein [Clostridiales bacterium UBA8960]
MNLKIEQLIKLYNLTPVLDHVDLELKDIQVLALIGASGSGKSTLLRLMAGLEQFDSGVITVNGHIVETSKDAAYRKKIGFVFQDHNLFPHLSITENIMLVLEKVHGRSREDVLPEVQELLTQFGLEEHADRNPHQISGGQAQRASIVRALAIRPELVLLDEPTSSLDPILTHEVLMSIKVLVEAKIDFVIVTHEIGFAREVADYIVFMDEGKIVEHGTKAMLEKPQTEKLKRFLEKVLSF